MSTVNNCNLPEDLYYLVDKHVWARRVGDDTVQVGLTDVAQSMAKTIISVGLKDVGRTVRKGRSIATVESGKWVGPVPSPFDGEIVEVNHDLATSPSTVNRDPYGEGWMAVLRFTDWDAGAVDLVTGPEGIEIYRQFLESEGIVCEP